MKRQAPLLHEQWLCRGRPVYRQAGGGRTTDGISAERRAFAGYHVQRIGTWLHVLALSDGDNPNI